MSYKEEHERFIEYLGQMTEAEGVPRIAARIFGLLLLSPEERSLDDIAEQLSVSRASVSTDARRLESYGLLERVTRRGDRRDYYQVAPDHTVRSLEKKAEMFDRFATVFEAGTELQGLEPVVRQRVEQCATAYRLLAERALQDLESMRQVFPRAPGVLTKQTPAQMLACRFRAETPKPVDPGLQKVAEKSAGRTRSRKAP